MESKKREKAPKEKEETPKKDPAPAEEAPEAAQKAAPKEEPAEEPQAPEAAAEKELAEAKAQAEDFKRKWYAVTAEYENYRRRTANDCARRYAEGRADVVSGLFPIADNLDRAYAVCSDEATKKGVRMVLEAFGKLLENEKISVIDPLGEPFDAEKHEAIMAVDAQEGEESGTVKQVYRKGYEQGGKVLRFAQVVVVK